MLLYILLSVPSYAVTSSHFALFSPQLYSLQLLNHSWGFYKLCSKRMKGMQQSLKICVMGRWCTCLSTICLYSTRAKTRELQHFLLDTNDLFRQLCLLKYNSSFVTCYTGRLDCKTFLIDYIVHSVNIFHLFNEWNWNSGRECSMLYSRFKTVAVLVVRLVHPN